MSHLCAAAWRLELENRSIGTVWAERNGTELSEKNGGWFALLEDWRGREGGK